MEISQKRAPKVEDPSLSRVIQKIYDDINSLINSVNQGNTSKEKPQSKGKAGDIRIVKNSEGLYSLEAMTNEGWITSKIIFNAGGHSDSTTQTGFIFKGK